MSRLFAAGALLLFCGNVQAEATHPLVRPPVAIKPSKAQMPMPLGDVLTKKTTGLDFETPAVAKLALKQAKNYIEFRRGAWSRARVEAWSATCEAGLNAKEPNPFCRIEQERALAGGTSRAAVQARRERQAFIDGLKAGDFEKSAGKSYPEVVAAVGSIGDVTSVVTPLARKVVAAKACLPASLTTAFAAKLEEVFPDRETVELSKSLYRRSVECGKDIAMATAAFRLGLILTWQKQYAEVDSLMRKVESIPEAQPLHARAKYWRYQTAIALGNESGRKTAKEDLLREHPLSFQNLAANGDDTAMMDRVLLRNMPNVYTRSLIRPDVNGVIRAAESLEKAGSPQLAADVLDRSVTDISTIEPEVRLYTAAFLHRIGFSLTKFKILSSLFSDQPKLVTAATMELMFPLSYLDLVRKKQSDLDPLLFLALMRQESAFNPDARSGVGARGLMQVMPATARLFRPIRKNQLFQPEINIEVGTKCFMRSLRQYGGDVELTLAAYNAGGGRVDQWLKRYPTENKFLFLDLIPYRETREYVSSILRNYYWYTRLYSPDTAAVASMEPGVLPSSIVRIQSILAANAGEAARMTPASAPAASAAAAGPRGPATLIPAALTPAN